MILASLVTFVVTICFKALTSQFFVITILHLLFVILFVTFFVALFVTFFVALFVAFRVALFVAFRVALFVIHLLPLRQHPHPKDLRDLFMKGSSFVSFSLDAADSMVIGWRRREGRQEPCYSDMTMIVAMHGSKTRAKDWV